MKLFSILLAAALSVVLGACQAETSTSETNAAPKDATVMSERITEFEKIDTVVGEGREAEAGLTVIVHYTGWLFDPSAEDKKGKKFDSSVDRGQPFEFPLGQGMVIQGWDQGFAGMKIGGKRTLMIPSEMGYGARGAGGVIPPNADLIFDVELLDLK